MILLRDSKVDGRMGLDVRTVEELIERSRRVYEMSAFPTSR